ncbi:MAG: lycopene cyclase domain-containing protein [Rhodothermales bacterium]
MQYPYFLWSLLLVIPWLAVYVRLPDRQSRKHLLTVSLLTAPLVTEPIFVPEYWLPPTLFDLAARTGFDTESLIFSFAVGGLASVGYDVFLVRHRVSIPVEGRRTRRHRYHLPVLLSAPVLFGILYLATSWNPIYSASLALLVAGMLTWYCRPDLVRSMFATGILFALFYFVFFLTLARFHPLYVEQVWNLGAISGALVAGVPLEELLFAFSFGFLWSSAYEHATWRSYESREVRA